jgi:hypothetical protein
LAGTGIFVDLPGRASRSATIDTFLRNSMTKIYGEQRGTTQLTQQRLRDERPTSGREPVRN